RTTLHTLNYYSLPSQLTALVSLPFYLSLLPFSNLFYFFFFNAPPPTEIYTLSLHDALPISIVGHHVDCRQFVPSSHLKVIGIMRDRKSTRLNSSHLGISYAVFCLKKKK